MICDPDDKANYIRKRILNDPYYSVVGPGILDALLRYTYHGVAPGDFLMAVLRNDLRCAIHHASEPNMAALPEILTFCSNELPAVAWGSYSSVRKWIEAFHSEREQDA